MSTHFEEAVLEETQALLDASKDPAYNNVYQKPSGIYTPLEG